MSYRKYLMADDVPPSELYKTVKLDTDSDTISRQAAIDALKNDMASIDHIIKGMSANDVRLDAYVSQRNQVNYDIYAIEQLPPTQPERIKGHWVDDCTYMGIQCSVCGKSMQDYIHATEYAELMEVPKFCPNCGADMRGGQDENR